MSYLSQIGRLSDASNLGGLVELQVARVADIISMSNSINGVVYGDITFSEGRGFVTWYKTYQTGRISSRDRSGREGSYKSNRLPFVLPKDNPAIRHILDAALEDEFVVLFRDSNNSQKIFGTKKAPVRFNFSHDSGSRTSQRNGYDCEFYYDGPDNIFFYDGSIQSPPDDIQPVIIKWNGISRLVALPGQEVNITSEFEINDFEIDLNVS
ncbi:MAG: hypothetical protein AAF363_18765 [Bacteroidota bacterium]